MKKLLESKFVQKYWHVLILFLFSLLPLVWFIGKGNALINGVDTNFPLDPKVWLIRRFYMWNNLANGGSDFSFAPAGIFFHIIQVIPYILGFSLQNVEKISLVFWFGLIVFSSYAFSGNFVKQNKLLRILFVCLYTLNIYMFNTWENIKVANLSLVAGIPLLLHVFLNLNSGILNYFKSGLILVLVSLILSGSGINPAYFITAFISLFIYAFSIVLLGEDYKKVFKNFLFVLLIILAVGSYWFIPTVSFVLRNVTQDSSIGSIGFNNWIDSLSENTSIINVLRLQGAWDWYAFDKVSKAPLFLPYTPNYFYRYPFILFSFIIPTIALLSLTFANKEKIRFYISFLVMFLLGIFLGAGSHEPTGIVFKWLTLKLPYFSLFRSPWYIFTPLLTLSLSGLTVLFFDRFKQFKVSRIFVIFLIISNIIYCYPLVTGRIFRPSKSDGFFVNFPHYIFEAENKLSEVVKNRTISYPDDQLEKFNWGYIGVEPVINLFSNNEMVFSGINNTQTPFSLLVSKFYEKIKINNFVAISNIASKLNVGAILEKTDQQSLSSNLQMPTSWQREVFDKWLIYKNNNETDSHKITLANDFYFGYGDNNGHQNISLLIADEYLINPNDSVVEKINVYKNEAGVIVLATNSQLKNYILNNIKDIDLSKVYYEFYIPEDGEYRPVIEKYGISDEMANNFYVYNGNTNVKWVVEKTDDSFVYFKKVYLNQGNYNFSLDVQDLTKSLVLVDSIEVLNQSPEDKAVDFNLPSFDQNSPYFISFDYSWNYGNKPLVRITQRTDQTLYKVQDIGLEANVSTINHKQYFEPIQTNSNLKISFISASTNSSEGTLVNYGNLKFQKVFTNNLSLIKDSSSTNTNANVNYQKISPVKYIGTVKDIKNPQTLIFNENYSDDWKIKITDMNGNKIRHRVDHFSINLYANAWYIDTVNQDFKFEIYYDPQKYFSIGVAVSSLSVLLIVLLYVKNYKKD